MSAGKIVAFIDTNIFLHFRRFTEIDWKSIFDADEVEIVVAQVVVRELDEQKVKNAKKHLRKRAGEVLTVIEKIFDGDTGVTLRNGSFMTVLSAEPQVQFSSENLNSDLENDIHLAQMIEFRTENPLLDIRLLSDDTSLRLKAKARKFSATSLESDFKLDEKDPEEEELKRLRNENESLCRCPGCISFRN